MISKLHQNRPVLADIRGDTATLYVYGHGHPGHVAPVVPVSELADPPKVRRIDDELAVRVGGEETP